MAKARSAAKSTGDGVARSSDAMILMIPQAMWEILVRQAEAEGRRPGDVLDDAVSSYLRERGTPELRAAIGGRR